MDIRCIKDVRIKNGTIILVRASLNEPIIHGRVASTYRLQKSAQTIDFLKRQNARVIVIGHIGRSGETLKPIAEELNKLTEIKFIPSTIGSIAYSAREELKPGEAILLENTRKDKREVENDRIYAEELINEAELFVFDDFSASHREHTSTTGIIDLLPSYAGIGLYEELTGLLRITDRLEHPAIAIVGGAKAETKIPLIKKLLTIYEKVFVGGVLANTILQKKGLGVGASKVDTSTPIDTSILYTEKLMLPIDFTVTRDFVETKNIPIARIGEDDIIVDIGDETASMLLKEIQSVKTVMMNGPTGWYEKGFSEKTLQISSAVGNSSAYSLVGGGDTLTLLDNNKRTKDWSCVSTGGGALLSYLAGVDLPALRALRKQKNTI